MGLVRRIMTSTDGKLTYSEFAKAIKPIDLKPYLRRIRKYTKEEKKQVELLKTAKEEGNFEQSRLDLVKPLTAFKQSEVMLKRDSERHVRLMPARYIMKNQLGESGQELQNLSKKFNVLEALEEDNQGIQGEIEKESRQLIRNKSATRELLHTAQDANITSSMFGVSLDQFNSRHEQTNQKNEGATDIGGGSIADFYERKIVS